MPCQRPEFLLTQHVAVPDDPVAHLQHARGGWQRLAVAVLDAADPHEAGLEGRIMAIEQGGVEAQKQKIRVDLQILGNTYSLMCDPHARGLFIDAAEHLNHQLNEMRREHPKLSLERLLMMGALQMTFELLQERQTLAKEVSTVNQVSERLLSALDQALEEAGENIS